MQASQRILAASILGSGAVFLEGTVVNVALPSIGHSFGLGLDGLQWVVTAYLLTLGSLILLGGALGDRYGRAPIFRAGCVGFAAVSALCAFAPNVATLAGLRFLQGMAGALLVPNSLAQLEECYEREGRGAAIGRWSAGSAASTAIGPLAGGLIVGLVSWRWIFAMIAPVALAAAVMLPGASPKPAEGRRNQVDYAGAALITLGLGLLTAVLIAGSKIGFDRPLLLAGLAVAAALLMAAVVVEHRVPHPLLAPEALRSPQFLSVNAATLLIYGAFGVLLFLLMLVLQNALGYTPLEAGSTLLPINVLLFLLSSRAGRWAARHGARLPMTAGALLAGAGLALFTRASPGSSYLTGVFPAVLVLGIGLAALVAPLTGAALDSLGRERAGLASGANNAVARLAGLIAASAVPLAAGMGGLTQVSGAPLLAGFARAMWICSGLCAVAAAVAWLSVPPTTRPT